MKKISFWWLFLFLIVVFPTSVKGEALPSQLTMKSETVDYSAEGYTPSVKCEDDEILPLITYFAIDTSTSSPVSIPVTEPGTYQIFASFPGNEKYAPAEATSIVTINPISVKISVPYSTVAYSRMENPVPYTVEPSWAEEYIDIFIEYYPIDSVNTYPDKKIDAPINLGLYYTVFNVTSKKAGIICENKYLVYEIAPYRGKKLSSEESTLSVPSSFSCTFQTINTTYSENTPVVCKYVLSPAAISGDIFYKKVSSDGSYSPPTKDAPIEPGEYICEYFLGNTKIGEGKIFIDKKEAAITVENVKTEYIDGGVYPSAVSDEKIEIAYTAFEIDESGKVSLEETPLPIKRCGKYYVIAYPTDTEHYKRSYSYGYLEITPSTPKITFTETNFTYDGTNKNAGVNVSPAGIAFNVEYYELDGATANIPLGEPPKRPGKYMVKVTAWDKNGNYVETTQSAVMYIDQPTPEADNSNQKDTSVSILEIAIICTLCIVSLAAITTVIIVSKKKKNV